MFQIIKNLLKKEKIVKKPVHTFEMYLDLKAGGVSSTLYHQGYREAVFMYIVETTVKPGMICFDLGANIGYVTLYMLKAIKNNGFVYAIEPDPRNIKLLNMNIDLNNFSDFCEISQGVIFNKTGKTDFYQASAPNLSSITKPTSVKERINVDSYTLDDYFKDRKFPHFIKMDVEGAEIEILESSKDFFKKHNENTNILMEVHQKYYHNNNLSDTFANILRDYFKIGFKPKYIVSTPVSIPEAFAKAGYTPSKTFQTDGRERGLFENVKEEDFISFACFRHVEGDAERIARSIMISRD